VEGEASDLYAEIFPDATPLAFANPIFVDADGDGSWQAPGLPNDMPDVIAHPNVTP
jgi:hypothetical protein